MLPIFIGALLSAIIAVLDTIWISASSVLSQNFVFHFVKPKNEKAKIIITKVLIVGVALIAYVLAFQSTSIYDLVQFSSSLGTAGILVITIFGLWTKFGNLYAPLGTLVVGFVTTPIAEHLFESQTPFLWSVALSVVTFLFLSLLESKFNTNSIK